MSIYEPTHTRECPHRLDSWSSKPCVCAAVERAQRDDEAWMHAACLSIAEGVPDWEKPLEHDSLAMRTVRALRVKYEESAHSLEVLAAENATLRERVESLEKSLARAQELSAQELRIHQAMVQAIAYRPDPGYTEEAARHAEEIARLNAAKADEIKLRREVAQERDAFQSSAERLWQLLDRIDTLDDVCGNDDRLFRKDAREIQRLRLQIAKSNDGQHLVWSHDVVTAPPFVGRYADVDKNERMRDAIARMRTALTELPDGVLIPPRQGFMTFAIASPELSEPCDALIANSTVGLTAAGLRKLTIEYRLVKTAAGDVSPAGRRIYQDYTLVPGPDHEANAREALRLRQLLDATSVEYVAVGPSAFEFNSDLMHGKPVRVTLSQSGGFTRVERVESALLRPRP